MEDNATDNQNGDEDDSDFEEINIWDLALQKTLVTTPPYNQGDNLVYQITITNEGSETVQNVLVNEYVPAGYTYNPASTINADWIGGPATPATLTQTIAGPIMPGDMVSLQIELELDAVVNGPEDWVNTAEIGAFEDENGDPQNDQDSTPDNDPDNDDDEEDDHDSVGPTNFDLAMKKTVATPPPYNYGQVITFDFTIYNQGNIDAYNIELVDYLPCGFGFDTSNPAWTYDTGTNSASQTVAQVTPLVAGDSMVVSMNAIVQQCTQEGAYINGGEIAAATDENGNPQDDSDSTLDNDPSNNDDSEDDEINGDGSGESDENGSGDEDDSDGAWIEIYDLALTKMLVTTPPYTVGSLLEFSIDICNQSALPATNIEISDYVPAGYTYNPAINTAWTGAGPTPTTLTYTYTGLLEGGDCVSVSLFLTLQDTGNPDDWRNIAEISGFEDEDGNPQDDIDSTPDNDPDNDGDMENDVTDGTNGDEDDSDFAGPTDIPSPQIRNTKMITNTHTLPNGNIDLTFEIGIKNTGLFDLTNLSLLDDLNTQLNPAFVGMSTTTSPNISLIFSTATSTPALNMAYDGNATIDLFNGSGTDLLEPDQEIKLQIVVEIDPNLAVWPLMNQTEANGEGLDDNGDPLVDENGDPVGAKDVSDSGDDYEGDNPNNPGDEGTADDPTAVDCNDANIIITGEPTGICEGTEVSLNVTSAVPNATYEWRVLGTTTVISTAANPTFSNILVDTDYEVTLILPNDVCAYNLVATTSVNVFVSPTVDIAAAYTLNEDCSPSDLSFTTGEVAGDGAIIAYSWTGPNGWNSNVASPVIPDATEEYNGSYTLIVTDENGCTATGSIQINGIRDAVVQPTIRNTGPACQGESITLSIDQYMGAVVTYTWTTPAGVTTDIIGLGTNEIVISPVDSNIHVGTYTLDIDVDGCQLSASYDVSVEESPVVDPRYAIVDACHNGEVRMYANATGIPPLTYLWTGPNGWTSTLPDPIITNADVTFNGQYELVVTNASGCVAIDYIEITELLPALPPATIDINGFEICEGECIELASSSPGEQFEWISTSDSEGSLLQEGMVTTTGMTTFCPGHPEYKSGPWRVRVTDANGCVTESPIINVTINPVPLAIAINSSPVCFGDPVSLTATDVPGATYAWYDNDPSSGGNLISTDMITTVNSLPAGSYTFYLQVELDGCLSELATTVVTVGENPTVTLTSDYTQNADCGAADLSLTSSITLGSAPIASYEWTGPNGFTSTLANPNVPLAGSIHNGSYILTVTDAFGCTGVGTVEVQDIVDGLVATPIISTSGPACEGETIVLTTQVQTGTAVTYTWTTPAGVTTDIDGLATNEIIISPLDPAIHEGNYSVTVNVDDCVAASADFFVEATPDPTAAPTATTTAICDGGDLQLFAGATDDEAYLWQGPNGWSSTLENPVISGVNTSYNGTYTLVVTNVSGCSIAENVDVISILAPPETPTIAVNEPNCEGEDLMLTTSSSGLSFDWIGPLGESASTLASYGLTTTSNSVSIPPSSPAYVSGLWSVRVTDENGCLATSTDIEVSINPVPEAIPSNSSPICEGAGDVSLFASTVDNAQYQWFDGLPAMGANLVSTNQNFNLFDPPAGTYDYYLVVSRFGCVSDTVATTVVVNALPLIAPQANYTLNEDCSLSGLGLRAQVSGMPPYGYQWTGPNGFVSTDAEPVIQNATQAANGSYVLTLTDANGCSATETVEINIIPDPIPQPVIASSGPTCEGGSITLTTQAYTGSDIIYTWTTPNGVVTDISGINTNEIIISPVDPSIHAGDYILTVEVDGCTLTSQVYNAEIFREPIAAYPTVINAGVCMGQDINLQSQLADYYYWSGPNGFESTLQNPTITNASLSANGTYYLTVGNEQGCESDPVAIEITVDVVPPTPTLTANNASICQGQDLVLTTSAQCDNYLWIGPGGNSVTTLSNPLLTTSINTTTIPADDMAYSQGLWSVVCVNGNGCESPQSATIEVDIVPIPTAFPTSSVSSACGDEPVMLFAGDGYPTGAIFTWYDSDPTTGNANIISNLQNPSMAGLTDSGDYTYWLTVTHNGCTSPAAAVQFTITSEPQVAVSNDGEECILNTTDVNLTATPSFGVPPYTYTWTGPNAFLSVNQSPILPNAGNDLSGTYTVLMTDANGCTVQASTVVDVTVVPADPYIVSNGEICNGEDVTLTAPNYTGLDVSYEWFGPNGVVPATFLDGNNIIIPNADNTVGGEYFVQVTVDGCVSVISEPYSVVVNDAPVVAPTNNGISCNSTTDDLVFAPNIIGGAGPYTYVWEGPNGFTSAAGEPVIPDAGLIDAGTYTLYVIDANGCQSETVATIVEPAPSTVTPEVSNNTAELNPACEGEDIQLQTPFVQGATYQWFGPNGFTSTVPNPALTDVSMIDTGAYYLVMNINGCESIAALTTVYIQPTPEAPIAVNDGPYCDDVEEITLRIANPDPELLYDWYRTMDDLYVGSGVTLTIPYNQSVQNGNSYYTVGTIFECQTEGSNTTSLVVSEASLDVAYAGEDIVICEDFITLHAINNLNGSEEGFWTHVSPDATSIIVSPDEQQTLVTNLEVGTNYFVWSLVNGACNTTSLDTVVVTYTTFPEAYDDNFILEVNEFLAADALVNDFPNVTNPEDYMVTNLTEPENGSLQMNDDGTFEYTPDENFVGTDTYIYEICHVHCPDNCVQAVVTIVIGADAPCVAPTIMTPNFDGVNDFFTIPCLANHPNSKITIFNRWGDEVYWTDNYQNDWAGTYIANDQNLPVGTYFYLLEVNDGLGTILSGYIFVQR